MAHQLHIPPFIPPRKIATDIDLTSSQPEPHPITPHVSCGGVSHPAPPPAYWTGPMQ
jgi:hypothetical protein